MSSRREACSSGLGSAVSSMTPDTFRSIRRILSFSFSSAFSLRASTFLALRRSCSCLRILLSSLRRWAFSSCSCLRSSAFSSCSCLRSWACSLRLAASSLDSSRTRLPPFFTLASSDFSVSSIRLTTLQSTTTSTVPIVSR